MSFSQLTELESMQLFIIWMLAVLLVQSLPSSMDTFGIFDGIAMFTAALAFLAIFLISAMEQGDA